MQHVVQDSSDSKLVPTYTSPDIAFPDLGRQAEAGRGRLRPVNLFVPRCLVAWWIS